MCNTTQRPRARIAWFALLLLTAWVTTTAIRIEIVNERIGGLLPRPQPPSVEGNDIPWRSGSRWLMEPVYRRSILYDRGMKEVQQMDDVAVAAIELTAIEKAELERMLKRLEYNSQLRTLVSGPGMLQYLLVPLSLVLGMTLWHKRSMLCRAVLSVCLVLCLSSGSLALYRQYFQAVID